ncbi:hypothetical protein ACF0H5_015520 [Mactra antiquata]
MATKAELMSKVRRYVLKQNPTESGCYLLSTTENSKKRKLTVDEIKVNVKKLVNHAFTVQPTNYDTDQPILTGKIVQHAFDEDDEIVWYKGTVISQVPGYPEFYNIIYEGDQAVYVYKLLQDYQTGDLKILVM